MNWSTYSRFVGDIFGAPLAMEGLAAFFLESTFLGLWIFGRGRLSPRRAPRLRSGSSRRLRCCRPSSSSRPTRGCSTRSATSSTTARPQLDEHLAPCCSTTRRCTRSSHMIFAALHDRRRWSSSASRPGSCGAARDVERLQRARCGSRCRSSWSPRCSATSSPATSSRDCWSAAADEDGRGRGAVRDRGGRRRSRSSRPATSTRNPGDTNRNIKIPHLLSLLATRTRGTARSQGVNDARRASTARSTGPASTRRSSRSSTGRSASWSTRGALMLLFAALIGLWLCAQGQAARRRGAA